MNKENVVYTYNEIPFSIKKEKLSFVTTDEMENIVFHEISQTQTNIAGSHIICGIKTNQNA